MERGMARDYEDFSSIEDLDDDELRQLIRSRLAEHPELDLDLIDVVVDQGTVRLEGRIGTEQELRMAEHVLTDVVGVVDFDNALVVDALRRAETPLDVEAHIQVERENAGASSARCRRRTATRWPRRAATRTSTSACSARRTCRTRSPTACRTSRPSRRRRRGSRARTRARGDGGGSLTGRRLKGGRTAV
jgi:hypothetical protein